MNIQEQIRGRIKNFKYEKLKNKYFITSVLFIIWVGFFDQNNLAERRSNMRQLRQLEKDQIYYEQKIDEVSARLNELKTNDQNLEKFAREQYRMKKPDEDVFVIVKE
jgi:cell division protein FtsB